jgi:hypothetical protein
MGKVGTGTFSWALAIAASAVLAWRLARRCGGAAGQDSPEASAGSAAAPVPGDAAPATAAARTRGTPAGVPAEEPIDGWTFSAADTAASEPPVEDQYIEDVSMAAHAAPIDAGSEPSPWRLRIAPAALSGRQEKPRGERPGTEEGPGAGAEGGPGDGPAWTGDDGERLAGPDTGGTGLCNP